jgi:hypothetical protein
VAPRVAVRTVTGGGAGSRSGGAGRGGSGCGGAVVGGGVTAAGGSSADRPRPVSARDGGATLVRGCGRGVGGDGRADATSCAAVSCVRRSCAIRVARSLSAGAVGSMARAVSSALVAPFGSAATIR